MSKILQKPTIFAHLDELHCLKGNQTLLAILRINTRHVYMVGGTECFSFRVDTKIVAGGPIATEKPFVHEEGLQHSSK